MMPTPLHIPRPGDKGESTDIVALKQSIIKTVVYFDIFHYPLSASEILRFLDRKSTESNLHAALGELLGEKKLFLQHGFFSIQNNPLLALRRQAGNDRANSLLKKANKIGRFLFHFPFIRAIAVSGSLSKNYADERADIDFFIITRSNRLWLARTIMHLYKKLTFLTGTQNYYCMNYYVDENALRVSEQHIFNAIEIKTLIPVCGKVNMDLFLEANKWVDNWLPMHADRVQSKKDPGRLWMKRFNEWLLDGSAGNFLERYFFSITKKRWEGKQRKGKLNVKGQPMDLIIDKHFSYSNPGNFKENVLAMYQQKLKAEEIKDFTISAVR